MLRSVVTLPKAMVGCVASGASSVMSRLSSRFSPTPEVDFVEVAAASAAAVITTTTKMFRYALGCCAAALRQAGWCCIKSINFGVTRAAMATVFVAKTSFQVAKDGATTLFNFFYRSVKAAASALVFAVRVATRTSMIVVVG